MNKIVMLLMVILLSGCTVGNGTICGFQTPMVECDKEAYEKALHPKPFVELWSKPRVSPETRLSNWVTCGGYGDGGFTFQSEKVLPGESVSKAYGRLSEEMYRCLIDKGYRYGRCGEADFIGDAICGGK